jgi:TolA-binding protein
MDYQRALIEFEKVFAFVNSNKEDAAQLKIGLCYKQLNQTDNARSAFQRFLMKYPDSEYTELARKFLAEL